MSISITAQYLTFFTKLDIILVKVFLSRFTKLDVVKTWGAGVETQETKTKKIDRPRQCHGESESAPLTFLQDSISQICCPNLCKSIRSRVQRRGRARAPVEFSLANPLNFHLGSGRKVVTG